MDTDDELGLSISTAGTFASSFDLQTNINRGETFSTGGLDIRSSGVARNGADHRFSVTYEDLQIGEVIGRGCSSLVLKAQHIGTNQPVALKVMNLRDKGKRNQLLNEIHALYHASHDTLIQFLGAFYREGAVTIVAEYMDGGSLMNVLQQVGAIPERPLSSITYQALRALAYLKAQKRVHRDIKPSNLLINSQGTVKITDFGVSAGLQTSIAMCGTFIGTFKYMSPERMKGDRYSYSSDLWSLGVVLVECATRAYPYLSEATTIDLIQAIVDAPAPALDPSLFSEDICRFIVNCLDKTPSHRTPCDVLLKCSWVEMDGVVDLPLARAGVKGWIESLSE